jgi:CheY-like chemotaxis protein
VGQAPLILIVEDSSDDVMLLKRAFAKAGVMNPLFTVNSGRQAVRYLSGEEEYADRERFPLPNIILLDLQMPDGDGFDVLRWIRNKFPQGGLLIIVLTRVEEIKKINQAYALGANSFLTKTGDPDELQQLINIFGGYWLLRNQYPEKPMASKEQILNWGIWK